MHVGGQGNRNAWHGGFSSRFFARCHAAPSPSCITLQHGAAHLKFYSIVNRNSLRETGHYSLIIRQLGADLGRLLPPRGNVRPKTARSGRLGTEPICAAPLAQTDGDIRIKNG
jgi:hypothetical protein